MLLCSMFDFAEHPRECRALFVLRDMHCQTNSSSCIFILLCCCSLCLTLQKPSVNVEPFFCARKCIVRQILVAVSSSACGYYLDSVDCDGYIANCWLQQARLLKHSMLLVCWMREHSLSSYKEGCSLIWDRHPKGSKAPNRRDAS